MTPLPVLLTALREEGTGLCLNAAEAIEALSVPTSDAQRLTDEQLRTLADDAFVVLNWARRIGFDRERQVAEVVKAFEVRLGYRAAVLPANPCGRQSDAR